MEDPEAIAELFIENPEAEKSWNLLSNRLSRHWRPKKFEEPDIELFVEAVLEDADEEADEVIIEETVVDLIIEAILEAAEGVETVRDKIAGGIEAIRDKIAGGGEAVRDKTAEEVEAVRKAAGRAPGAAEVVECSR